MRFVGASAPLWPFLLYTVSALALVAAMLGLSHVLGQRHSERATGVPFESGIVPTGSARVRFSAGFYLLAVFFVIFDLEIVFLVGWALAARLLGWPGYIAALVFIAVLFIALGYLWRDGALDWGTSARKRRQRMEERR